MKTLLSALVLTLATTALADDQMKTDAQTQQQTNNPARVKTGVDATEVGPGIKEAAKDTRDAIRGKSKEVKQDATAAVEKAEDKAGLDTARKGTFDKAKAFTVNGTLKNPAGGGVTIVRDGLPDADLDVRQDTLVMLDGKKVDSSNIPEGSQVRARFQLEGEEAVAVELNATSPKGTHTPMKK